MVQEQVERTIKVVGGNMRKIGFRGLADNNKWKYGLIEIGPTDVFGLCPKINEGLNSFSVRKDTIGQLIGIKDKNGVDIFEGDVVIAFSNITGNQRKFTISFDEARLHFGFIPEDSGYCYSIDELLSEIGEELYFEIIGNKYDNR